MAIMLGLILATAVVGFAYYGGEAALNPSGPYQRQCLVRCAICGGVILAVVVATFIVY